LKNSNRCLLNEPDTNAIRQITEKDQSLFEAFENRNSETDLDEAGVELENDGVFGLIENGDLICVADYYCWQKSEVADIGVLTQPDRRGKGVASSVVKALCQHAKSKG
jgi:predicted GNAT family acetyltransferase